MWTLGRSRAISVTDQVVKVGYFNWMNQCGKGVERKKGMFRQYNTKREVNDVNSYVMFSKLTNEESKTISKNPDRIKEVNKEVEEMGGRVIAQYLVFGEYDFLTIIEAPDNETMARISLNLSSRGTIRITSVPAIPIDTYICSL